MTQDAAEFFERQAAGLARSLPVREAYTLEQKGNQP